MAKQVNKRGKWSKLELRCLDHEVIKHGVCGVDLKELSEIFKRSELSIKNLIIDRYANKPIVEEIPVEDVKPTPAPVSQVRNLFARREGIAVMTPGASEAIDDLNKSSKNAVNSRNEAAIFRQDKTDYSGSDNFNVGKRY